MKKTELLTDYPVIIFVAIFLAAIFSGTAFDRAYGGMVIYPAKDQSPEQQKQDEYECHQWAVQQTGLIRPGPSRSRNRNQHLKAERFGGLPAAHWSVPVSGL